MTSQIHSRTGRLPYQSCWSTRISLHLDTCLFQKKISVRPISPAVSRQPEKKEKRNSSLTMANLDRIRSHWTSEPVPKHDHVFGHPYGNRHVDFFNDYDANAPFTVCSSMVLRWVGRSTRWKNAIRWIPERGVAKTSLLAEMQSNRPEFVVDWTMSDGGTVNWITTYYTATCHRVENTLDSGPSWRPPLLKVLIHF